MIPLCNHHPKMFSGLPVWAGFLAAAAAVRLLVFLLRLVYVLPVRFRGLSWFAPRRPLLPRATTMVVWGSGGHTGEMCKLLPVLVCGPPPRRYTPLLFVTAATDTHSPPKAAAAAAAAGLDAASITWLTLPRAREVGQSWASTPLSTARALWAAVTLMRTHAPDLLLCNGPGTCVPLCAAAVLLHFLGVTHTRIVYVESVCRTRSLSITGRILYPLADRFLVQWPRLTERWPAAEYVGLLF